MQYYEGSDSCTGSLPIQASGVVAFEDPSSVANPVIFIAILLIFTALLLVLQNLVNLLGIPSSLNFAVMGAVVLVGVLADQIFQNRAAKKTMRQAK